MDNIMAPAHYTVYPVHPIEITRHLGFCLGNATKYVLRAPYKGGVEDCLKAKQYLEWELETPMLPLATAQIAADKASELAEWLYCAQGDVLWRDIAGQQYGYLKNLALLLSRVEYRSFFRYLRIAVHNAMSCADELRRVLSLRDTTGQIYEGMSGLPQKEQR